MFVLFGKYPFIMSVSNSGTPCLLSLRPRNIHWSKINDTLPERAEISGPTFQISRLSQSHNGTYLCQAQNNYGRAADHYTLLVYGELPRLKHRLQ